MTLDAVLADALAATTAAGGHPDPFQNNRDRTTQVIQALILYAGLAALLLSIAEANSTLDEIHEELKLIRDAIHRA
jgi:hypothetical protein